MKGKINSDGELSIERAGEMEIQYCVYREDIACGHHCPLFSNFYAVNGTTHLKICHKTTLVFEELKDERKRANTDTF